ncbi:TIGR03617 family F420-dependent LLM class oxidoreductase [Mycolicibacter kumamotonensis]|uniref:F420-dependent oxidoreductase n=1 Tax=Mycolicibacter kumamotonensis TaxID=354243 RepID=A0A1B8SIL0_9MYCO|nr:TIGR03617 family F420-dependent LLM class oxidoreductase [Mycolicibacter kumamotonensis]OBY32534.1 F420-dependent oxidoreductase [Mycolicibacter kumamotonensis]
MKVDYFVVSEAGDWERAAWAEQHGYDGVWLPEITHDPFPMLAVAATHTATIQLGTSIALAFARNPMSLAMVANDLQLYSGGRFVLGVGSQIKAHITRRFSMPWSAPAPRMREYLLAVRAIWRSWATGEPLQFTGEYYTHTLMTPFFSPGPNPYGNPLIMLAGVGTRMTEVAGEVADGFFVHPFTTERYLRETTLPALRRGRAAGGEDTRDGFEISGLPFIVTGTDSAAVRVADAAVRRQIAFYGSTPAYRPVLDVHGWGDLAEDLSVLSKRNAWDEMGRRITDEMLHEFAIVAPPRRVAEEVLARYGDVLTRTGCYAPYPVPEGFWQPIMYEVRTGVRAGGGGTDRN